MPVRILHIIPTLTLGGAEKQLCFLATGLPRDEFDVHVACLTSGGPREADLQAAGIPVTQIDKRWKFDPGAYSRLKREISRLKPDIVHTWLFAANSYGRQAAIANSVPTIIAAERCVDPWKRFWQFAIDRRLAKRTDCIVTNTPAVRDFYAARGIAADKFTIISNGVAPTTTPKATRAELLAELKLPEDVLLIGAIGRLWPQKNYKHLMWAMCMLKEIRQDFQVLVFGDGPQRWRLERYQHQVQIEDHVRFLGERLDVDRFLPHLDLFVNTSSYEGQSNAIMEAMAAGLPVVATDIPGTRDLVVDQQTGYLTPLGDRAELARWVNELFDDPGRREQMGAAGRERMLTQFSVEAMVEAYAELYRG